MSVVAMLLIGIFIGTIGMTQDRLEKKGYKQPESAITAFYEAWIAPDAEKTDHPENDQNNNSDDGQIKTQ